MTVVHDWLGLVVGAEGGVQKHPLSVLIVDDEAAVARHLADGLTLLGFVTEVAHSAQEALAHLTANPEIGVVVTDVRMPGGDGLLLAQHILRERRGLAALQVILITGHATLDDATAAIRTGVSDFIRKPFRLAEAATAVRRALEVAEASRAEEARKVERAGRISELERLRDELDGRLAQAEALLRAAPDVAGAYRANLAAEIRAISHALRTPLNHIAGGTDLLAAEGRDQQEPAVTYLRSGLQDVMQAVELVEELQRAGQPSADLPNDDVDLAVLVASVAQHLTMPCAESGVSLALVPAATPPRLRAPEAVIRRILTHAMCGALDWTPNGGALEIKVGQLSQEDGRRWCTVTIACGAGAERLAPPEGPTFPLAASPFCQTQEGLRFAIARRLAANINGFVTSWSPDHRTMAIRIALPG